MPSTMWVESCDYDVGDTTGPIRTPGAGGQNCLTRFLKGRTTFSYKYDRFPSVVSWERGRSGLKHALSARKCKGGSSTSKQYNTLRAQRNSTRSGGLMNGSSPKDSGSVSFAAT